MTSSDLNYLPKAPSLNIVTFWVRVSTYELGTHKLGDTISFPAQFSAKPSEMEYIHTFLPKIKKKKMGKIPIQISFSLCSY